MTAPYTYTGELKPEHAAYVLKHTHQVPESVYQSFLVSCREYIDRCDTGVRMLEEKERTTGLTPEDEAILQDALIKRDQFAGSLLYAQEHKDVLDIRPDNVVETELDPTETDIPTVSPADSVSPVDPSMPTPEINNPSLTFKEWATKKWREASYPKKVVAVLAGIVIAGGGLKACNDEVPQSTAGNGVNGSNTIPPITVPGVDPHGTNADPGGSGVTVIPTTTMPEAKRVVPDFPDGFTPANPGQGLQPGDELDYSTDEVIQVAFCDVDTGKVAKVVSVDNGGQSISSDDPCPPASQRNGDGVDLAKKAIVIEGRGL